MTTDNPFKPGARVAIERRFDGFVESFVDKVYKNGNFTLKGSTQQWRPSRPWGTDGIWTATKTGQTGYWIDKLRIWNEQTDAAIAAAMSLSKRKSRREKLLNRFEHMKAEAITDAMLDQIEAALDTPNQGLTKDKI